jgi:two-component system, NarL family, sensor kinase
MADTPAFPSETVQLRRRNRELSILNAITEALHREVDLTQALRTVLAQVAEFFDLHTGWIWLLSETTDEPYVAAVQNLPPALINNPTLMEGDCYCLRTYREGDLEGAANVNVVTCSRIKGLIDGTDGLRYHASIPLYASNTTRLGVLNVASEDWRELSADDLRLLYTVGDLLSIAIERARLYEQSMQLGASEERNRLAREIHDTLAQGLAAIALQLESAEALLEAGTDTRRLRHAITQALTLTRANLEEARRSVLDLRAAPLEGRTLIEALASLLQALATDSNLNVDFHTVGGARPLPPRLEVGLYRIAQEALMNVVQHAAAGQVSVHLVTTPDAVQLAIEDDGCGFDPAMIPPDHYGLIGLNERARLLGGTLRIESSVDVGTRLEIQVPLSASGPAPHMEPMSPHEDVP